MARDLASGDYAGITNNARMTNTVGAVAYWLKTTIATAFTGVIARAENTVSGGGITMYLNHTGFPGQIIMLAKDLGGGARITAGGAAVVNDGNWHHICWNFQVANGAANDLYIDGVADGTANSSAAWSFGANDFRAGRVTDTFFAAFVGTLAEVAWFNVRLTAAEIASMAKGISPRHIRPGSLVFHLPLVRAIDNPTELAPINSGGSVSDHPRRIG